MLHSYSCATPNPNLYSPHGQVKKHRDIRNHLIGYTHVNNLSIRAWENDLSTVNSRALYVASFTEYLMVKTVTNFAVRPFYRTMLFRSMRFSKYHQMQKVESRMLNDFRAKFGGPEDTIVCIGDWLQKQHRRFHEPVKGKGFRDLFRRAGYKVYLVDEHKTSCCCSKCQCDAGVCATFRQVNNPRPWRVAQQPHVIRHGLVRCANAECRTLWNRDRNAACNIWKIAEDAVVFYAI